MFSTEKLTRIASAWDVGNIESISALSKEDINTHWLVQTSEGRFILQQRKFAIDKRDLLFEIKYIHCLKNNLFPYELPMILLTTEGEPLQGYEENYYILYKYIDGEYRSIFNSLELDEVAFMMANYHNILLKVQLDNDQHYSDIYQKNALIEELLTYQQFANKTVKPTAINEFVRLQSPKLLHIIETLNTKNISLLPLYAIHRDLTPKNLLWKKNQLIGLLDFENVSNAHDPFIKDLAVLVNHYCKNTEKSYETDFNKAKYILQQYSYTRPLSIVEITLLPEFLVADSIENLCYQLWQYYQYNKDTKEDIDYYLKNILWHDRNKQKIRKELLDLAITNEFEETHLNANGTATLTRQ